MSHPCLRVPFRGKREFGVAPPYSIYHFPSFFISLLRRGHRKYSGGFHPLPEGRELPPPQKLKFIPQTQTFTYSLLWGSFHICIGIIHSGCLHIKSCKHTKEFTANVDIFSHAVNENSFSAIKLSYLSSHEQLPLFPLIP